LKPQNTVFDGTNPLIIQTDQYISPAILSVDILPFDYQLIYEFPLIFWCACRQQFVPNSF